MNPTLVAVKRPVTMLMIVLGLVLMGIISYPRLPVQQLPTTSFPFVTVVINYPGASPEDMEQLVTGPVENAVSGVAGIQQVNGLSGNGLSRVSMQFANGTDVNVAANDVSQAITRLQRNLPSGIQTPSILKANPNASPILNLAISGEGLGSLYDIATNTLQPSLQEVPGVAAVGVNGGLVPQVNVVVKPDALSTYGVSLSQLSTAISSQNVSTPGGNTTEGNQTRTISTNAYFQSANDLRNLVIQSRPGSLPLTLGQIANVSQGYATVNQIAHLNGEDTVVLSVTAQSGANQVQVDKDVKAKLAQMRRVLPKDLKMSVINDNTVYTNESIRAVEDDLILAIILPAIVLLLFLHRIRNMIIVVIAIPTSLISTFTIMYFAGFSLDLISLLALSLITGILVDDSVVVLENINRHLAMGKPPLKAALDGRLEIGLAALAITMTDVVVYLPVAFTPGIVGQIFREFGLTIVTATLFSLFVSFTVTPLLASRWLKEPLDEEALSHAVSSGGPWQRFTIAWEHGYGRIRTGYGRLIHTALNHRPWIILIGVGALALSVAIIPLGWLGTEFTPQEDNSQFSVNISLPNGAPLSQTAPVVEGLDQQIRAMPGVLQTYSSAGARGGFFGGANTNSGQISVDLVPVGQRAGINTYISQVRALGRKYPVATVTTNVESPLRIGGQRAVGVVLLGQNIDVLNQVANQVTLEMQKIPGVVEVRNEASNTVPELAIEINRAAAAEYGINANQIGSAVASSVAGSTVSNLRPNGSSTEMPIVLSIAGSATITPAQIEAIPLVTSSGTVLTIGQVASVIPSQAPAQLNDQNRQLEVTVSANTFGVPLGQIATAVTGIMNHMTLPAGVTYTLNGAAQQQAQVFAPLEGAFALSIILVYMLTSALYESLLYPLAVLLSLPLATVGALGALALTGNTLNLYSFMGLIMLMGLVAKNAILLVDFTNTLRTRGYSRIEALAEAGRTRLRPILMTTSTMVFAMLPLAVKIGAGSEERSPMATVLVGGLLTSTLLTLVFVPVVYSYLDDFGNLLGRLGLMAPHQWTDEHDPLSDFVDIPTPALPEPVLQEGGG
ncbi:MAG TPA: efflux RND transporter permease subunit [Chloroflexota bacterium]|nr:efflux RND transporter permease subunit [Chloroflexota bacterium]